MELHMFIIVSSGLIKRSSYFMVHLVYSGKVFRKFSILYNLYCHSKATTATLFFEGSIFLQLSNTSLPSRTIWINFAEGNNLYNKRNFLNNEGVLSPHLILLSLSA